MALRFISRLFRIHLFMFALSCQAESIDYVWEQQVAEKLSTSAMTSQVVWLAVGSHQFIGLFNQQTASQLEGAAIILHPMGAHADWPKLISPLRQTLPELGWSTLSIQMPLIAAEKPLENYGRTLDIASLRIEAAVQYLRQQNFSTVVLIGHGFGAATALSCVANKCMEKIDALVTIGLQEYAFLKPAMDILGLIRKIRIPLFDIYGEKDYPGVIELAPDRRLAANSANNQLFQQKELTGADHFFYAKESDLSVEITTWLRTVLKEEIPETEGQIEGVKSVKFGDVGKDIAGY